ncbi:MULTISPECIES: flagellar biosynthetic protein FliR [Acidocella]|uniref:flagellar biosynthetic protein FliR n=1 Tax=Acidocella TaxID=50709 RepID=UPI0006873C85|nr:MULTISPECIES: flagellar biosynthetic protein FliR [Acidocella]
MVLDEQTVMLWFGRFLWPFLRITGLFLTAPLFGSALLPNMVKALLAAALALALALWLPDLPAYPADPARAILTGFEQIAYGALLGMAAQIVLAALSSAGEIIGEAMGLSFATLQFRDAPGASSVLADIMQWAGLLGYMAAGGPVWLFMALAHSFAHGAGVAPLQGWGALAGMGGVVFSAALALALPVLAAGFCVNLTVGLATIFAPSLNLLSVGFPLLILAGLWVLVGMVPAIGVATSHLTAQSMAAIAGLMPHG